MIQKVMSQGRQQSKSFLRNLSGMIKYGKSS